jgi:hypothetical protein
VNIARQPEIMASAAPINPEHAIVMNWSNEDVIAWVASVGPEMKDYLEAFRADNVDGKKLLLKIDSPMLRITYRVHNLSHQHMLRSALYSLRKSCGLTMWGLKLNQNRWRAKPQSEHSINDVIACELMTRNMRREIINACSETDVQIWVQKLFVNDVDAAHIDYADMISANGVDGKILLTLVDEDFLAGVPGIGIHDKQHIATLMNALIELRKSCGLNEGGKQI